MGGGSQRGPILFGASKNSERGIAKRSVWGTPRSILFTLAAERWATPHTNAASKVALYSIG